ncbi:MAG TPA: acyl-CoA thioesterase [Spirochaetia bacterium]|nr:acyl-CoA thioesterase [Spirochaetia bacterium]
METFVLVRPEHLNHYGNLFGGQLLKWVDECAWLAASREFPGRRLVTRAMAEIDFKIQVANGSILRFDIGKVKEGTSSVTYQVKVFGQKPDDQFEKDVFFTIITFVCIDQNGKKRALR